MKKRNNLLVINIVIGLIIVIILLNRNSNNYFKNDEVTYALMVDGVKQTKFPPKGPYKVAVNCENATGEWDYNNWNLVLKDNSNGNVSCNLSFAATSPDYLNKKIIELSGTTQGTGKVINEPTTDYRYEGKNPNNWIWFNNELWRIIGVFDTNTHNQTDDSSTITKENQLVKIIRNDSLGGLAWNATSTNDWENSSIKVLLNGAYYNKENGNDSDYCYLYSTSVPGKCDYTNIGIDSSYRNMIKDVIWKVGGHTTTTATAAAFYTAERGSTTGNSNAYASEVNGYIGLMYVSDYGYSVMSSTCARTTNISSYNTSTCVGNSWLGLSDSQWTLSIDSTAANKVFLMQLGGGLISYTPYEAYFIRPTLYLNANVYVLDGTGTVTDPYIIGI